MGVDKVFDIGGFSKFKMSQKEYLNFIKNTKINSFLFLKNTKKNQIFLESETDSFKECIIYVFYILKEEIYFKMSKLEFKKEISKNEILKYKNELSEQILLKSDDVRYDLSSSANNPYGIFSFR